MNQTLYRITTLKDKIRAFERKYQINFSQFKDLVENAEEENFEMWDDFIEWEATEGFLGDLTK